MLSMILQGTQRGHDFNDVGVQNFFSSRYNEYNKLNSLMKKNTVLLMILYWSGIADFSA